MTDKTFSSILKEKRKELGKTQTEMAHALGMKLRMYQLYEKGEFDKSKNTKKEKYLHKLAQLKPQVESELTPSRIAELEKEIQFLHKMVEDKQQTIDAHEKTIAWLEHFVNEANRKIASGVSVKKNLIKP